MPNNFFTEVRGKFENESYINKMYFIWAGEHLWGPPDSNFVHL